ncbi:MAG: PhzF family phenazine biosynthesis protein [Myxococcota bacterium]
MQVRLVQVDAFTERPLAGNPAAVMILPRWVPDPVLAAVAAENNLSETAFLVREPAGWRLRWFTPTVEVELCGHATLAAGSVVLADEPGPDVVFHTASGPLVVRRAGRRYSLRLPALAPRPAEVPAALIEALGHTPEEVLGIKAVHRATYWLARYRSEEDVAALDPDVRRLGRELRSNVVCTAPGASVDFVSRFFAPGSGVDEDPVTGSAHATLTPYWRERLGKNPLVARQISRRGGDLECEQVGEDVWLTGGCATYLEGTATVPD